MSEKYENIGFKSTSDLLPNAKSNNNESEMSLQYRMARRFCDLYNSKVYSSPFVKCNKCNGSGKIAIVDEVYLNPVFVSCSCAKQRKCMDVLDSIGLAQFVVDMPSLEDLSCNEQWEKHCIGKMKDYLESESQKYWFFIGGQVGSGKTTKGVIILKQLIERYEDKSFYYFNWDTKYKDLEFNNEEAKASLRNKLLESDILYIDDFYRHQDFNISDMERRLGKEIIEYRDRNNKQTIITSELTLNEIIALDESTGSRIEKMCLKNKFTLNIGRDSNRNYRRRDSQDIL